MLEGKKVVIKTSEDMPAFDPLPDDKYTVQIVDVNAVEQANSFKGGAMETRLNYQFVIVDDKKELKPGVSLYGRYLWKRTSLSMHEKSWLRKLARAVYGRDLSVDEQKSFDPESVIGKNVDVMTEQSPSKDGSRVFSNIISFTKASLKGCMGQELKPFDFADAKKKAEERKAGIEKSSTPLNKVQDDNSVSEKELDELFSSADTPKKAK